MNLQIQIKPGNDHSCDNLEMRHDKGQKLVHNFTFRTRVPRNLKNAKSGGVPAPLSVAPGWWASKGIDIMN